MLQQALKQLLQFLTTPTHCCLAIELNLIHIARHRNLHRFPFSIHISEHNRCTKQVGHCDNTGAVEDPHLINKSSAPIRICNCKLSGYSPKPPPEKLFLQGHDTTVELAYPQHDLFVNLGSHPAEYTYEYVLNPYTEQQMWVFYRSGIVTMTNLLRAPIVLRDVNGKRKSVQVAVPRNMDQIQLYREAAMRWSG